MQTVRTCAILSVWSEERMSQTKIKSIFETEPDESEEARLDAQAMAAYRSGRVVPHAKVAEWLDSWGTPDELPCPKPEPG
jgi:predicted transcriptional regulator